jgi:hypothetical protein
LALSVFTKPTKNPAEAGFICKYNYPGLVTPECPVNLHPIFSTNGVVGTTPESRPCIKARIYRRTFIGNVVTKYAQDNVIRNGPRHCQIVCPESIQTIGFTPIWNTAPLERGKYGIPVTHLPTEAAIETMTLFKVLLIVTVSRPNV